MSTSSGIPAPSDEFSLSLRADGPLLLQDHYVIQKMAQFNRERVPERVVPATGSGAFGFLEITHYNAGQPVYAPNSYGGPKADPEMFSDPSCT